MTHEDEIVDVTLDETVDEYGNTKIWVVSPSGSHLKAWHEKQQAWAWLREQWDELEKEWVQRLSQWRKSKIEAEKE